ncbi:MAG: 4-hydroxythreonine-4-phosphate dehydrogenase PdxA [Pseudomonadota bacterium]
MTTRETTLVVTAGDPAGIGPDLCITLGAHGELEDAVVVGDERVLRERAKALGADFRLNVIDLAFPAEVVPGQPDPANARVLVDGLDHAIDGCLSGRYAALVTAPVAKHIINDAGIPFTGHTEYLAERSAAPLPVMLLATDELRVALVTTHLPLASVPAAITPERLRAVIEVLHKDLITRFGCEDPRIIVCGLNPHAGENGLLGREDSEVIEPVLAELRKRGMQLIGPTPADTAFTPQAGPRDAVLAMYHDQGLPVIKYAGFSDAVNVTLGLPIIRTSVDHGTAFSLAGSGRADSGSFRRALKLARTMARAA